jgi:hypothetical protein
VLFVEIPGLYEEGMIFAFAIRTDVSSAVSVRVIVATLAYFCLAWRFFAEGALGMMVHAAREGSLYLHRFLEGCFLPG